MLEMKDFVLVRKADVNEGFSTGTITKAALFFTKKYMFVVPIERVEALADISNLFYISGAGIVGTYMGTTAYLTKNGK